jgi:hemerythrin-like domain-containing protein
MSVMRPDTVATASQRAVQRLAREHGDVAKLLALLDANFVTMKGGGDVDDQLLLDAMSYLTGFVQSFHHAKEELAVEAVGDRSPAIQAIRGELTAQHCRIRDAGAALRDGLERALLDAPVLRQELADDGFAYTSEARHNMAFEEASVFRPLAETLDAEAWARIDAKLGSQRDPLFGEVVHQRYANLFRELTCRFGCEGSAYD